MRTDIEIEDHYVQTIMDRYGVRTNARDADLRRVAQIIGIDLDEASLTA